MAPLTKNWTAFCGSKRVAAGAPADVARQVKAVAGNGGDVVIFNDTTGRIVDIDLRGSEADVLARIDPDAAAPKPDDGGTGSEGAVAAAPRRRGRPRLGVTPREITLLPRHWEWLDGRDGGASVTLRRLVDAAMRGEIASERIRAAQEAAHRFLTTMAGNDPGYESALRMLYNGDKARFEKWTTILPGDIGAYARQLAAPAFADVHRANDNHGADDNGADDSSAPNDT